MNGDRNGIEAGFQSALDAYLAGGGEAALLEAHELGRRALTLGMGVLDVASLLHASISTVCDRAATRDEARERLALAEAFVLDVLTPFEMSHRSVHDANDTLRRLNELLEEETRRLAHEVHDTSGQLLASVYIAIDEVATTMDEDARGRLVAIKIHLDEIQSQLRRISHELRPTMLDDLGLMPALTFMAQRFGKTDGLNLAVEGNVQSRLDRRLETALYRVAEEAVRNAARHARAKQIKIRLEWSAGRIQCVVEDDGVGFRPEARGRDRNRRGLGMIGMRERIAALGGQLVVDSAPGRGTRLVASVPVEAREAAPVAAT